MVGEVIASIQNLSKTYRMGSITVEALRDVSIDFYQGEYIAIMGPSGCGKSTMLNLLGCLDQPTSGKYILGGDDTSTMDDDQLSTVRGTRIGFIFQSYNLIQQLSVVENIEVPLYYQGCPEKRSKKIATDLAALVGLEDRLHHKPFELSGGQQQRVAIARALSNDPLILLCDEPTGNLDSVSGKEILELFDTLHDDGKTIISVTHDPATAEKAQRIIRLRDGKVEQDVKN